MEDMTFVDLQKQITKTEIFVYDDKCFNSDLYDDNVMDLILENQLHIMKVLDKIDDKLRTLSR